MDILSLLKHCLVKRASDLHLSPDSAPRLRIDGNLLSSDLKTLNAAELEQTLKQLIPPVALELFEQNDYCDFRLDIDSRATSRVHIYKQQNGYAAAIRLIPMQIPTLATIQAPSILSKISPELAGLILITGPTGSGKSTTLAALVEHLNSSNACHILTLEDPIEFLHPNKKSLVTQRTLSTGKNGNNLLKSVLREDPDVILIGEMRDTETISLALETALTGHLVLASLHTHDTAQAIARIISRFALRSQESIRAQLAQALHSIIAQTLIKSPQGMGRVAAFEVMLATPAIRHLIRENKLAQIQSVIQTNQHIGMQTKEQSLQKCQG